MRPGRLLRREPAGDTEGQGTLLGEPPKQVELVAPSVVVVHERRHQGEVRTGGPGKLRRIRRAPTPAGLHIAEATDLDAFVGAYARVSGIPAEGAAAAIEREKAFAGDGTVIRLAGRLDDGRIVGTAVAWLSHGLLTLYFVGTQPEQRRRGIGAAMTRAALDLAAGRGVRTAALTSTPVGEPVYRRLGFRTVGTFRLLTF